MFKNQIEQATLDDVSFEWLATFSADTRVDPKAEAVMLEAIDIFQELYAPRP